MASHPEPALPWLLRAVRDNRLLALGQLHGCTTQLTLIEDLMSHPDFTADDLVIEFGNSLHQPVLDRYIRGEDVPINELRRVWRDTTQSPINTWEDPIYAQLLAVARKVNLSGRRLRVLAGDPPIDWSMVRSVDDWMPFITGEDHAASLVEREVLARGRRAVLLYGAMRFLRTVPSGLGACFRDMPVVVPHGGYGALNEEVERALVEWQPPCIALVRGTLLGAFTMAHLNSDVYDPQGRPVEFPPWRWDELFDHYLYMGPRASLQWSQGAPSPDPAFDAELRRRRKIVS